MKPRLNSILRHCIMRERPAWLIRRVCVFFTGAFIVLIAGLFVPNVGLVAIELKHRQIALSDAVEIAVWIVIGLSAAICIPLAISTDAVCLARTG